MVPPALQVFFNKQNINTKGSACQLKSGKIKKPHIRWGFEQ